MTVHRFRSRVDVLIAVLLVVPIVAFATAIVMGRNDGVGTPVIMLVSLVFITVLIGWILLDTSYTVMETELLIRSGPIRDRVPLERIRRIQRSNTLQSAPALSLRRLEIEYGSGGLAIISPEREAEFLKLLQERVPTVELKGFTRA